MLYAALLRAINLPRHNKLTMADLRAVLAGLGYSDVVTHLQSGNAVFSTTERSAADLEHEISEALATSAGVACAVMIRSGAELAAAIDDHPLGTEPENPSRYFVAFLAAEPDEDKVAAVRAMSFDPDKVWVRGREAYMWLPNGAAETKLTNATLEKRLGVAATSRNWNTVNKLATLTAG
ncbi:MAG TPA: DUF1697 domain-containing protein [Streptosporangiaceae bacterium]|nr:DUF1697 domain-containing protein [Streptosporangiaceae bacterium]